MLNDNNHGKCAPAHRLIMGKFLTKSASDETSNLDPKSSTTVIETYIRLN